MIDLWLQNRDDISVHLCWAHARRKFADIVKANKKKRGKANVAIDFIAKLYAIETKARVNHYSHTQRQQLRQKKSLAILERFKSWLEETKRGVPPSFPIGQAVEYALKHWPHLITYIDNGEVEIENMIRPFALGRKDWLFQNSTAGARASASIYSLMQTCKIHCVEPYAYFKYVLANIKRWPPDDYKSLLPMFIDQEKIMLG